MVSMVNCAQNLVQNIVKMELYVLKIMEAALVDALQTGREISATQVSYDTSVLNTSIVIYST